MGASISSQKNVSATTNLACIRIECTQDTHRLQHLALHLNPDLLADQKLAKHAKQLGVLHERVDDAPRVRADLAERAERRLLLLVRRLRVLERADEQREDLADERDEVLARDAPQQADALDHVPGDDRLRVSGFGEEDVEERVRVGLDEAVGG